MALLRDKVAIVTGAGGGIGRAHALALAEAGAAVVVNDLGGARDGSGGGAAMADSVVAEIEAAGGRAVANYDSVGSVEGGEHIVRAALDTYGQIDCVVNNAGILRDKTLAKMDEGQWDAVIEVHLKGTYNVTRPAFLHMRERGAGGSIINTSSTSGLEGNFGQTNYGAAKAGIAGFTRCLALEGEKHRIRVNAIAPAALTRMTEDLPGAQSDRFQQMVPEHIAPLIVYLASDLSREVTKRIFFIGGGRISEMRMVRAEGVRKESGLWTAQEIADQIDTILE